MGTLTIRNRLLPGGEDLPGGMTVDITEAGFSTLAWPTISVEISPGEYRLYHFYFINRNGTELGGRLINFSPLDEDVYASAWYWEMAGFKPPPESAQAYLFHINSDRVFDETPIRKTYPESAWDGVSTIASTAAVTEKTR